MPTYKLAEDSMLSTGIVNPVTEYLTDEELAARGLTERPQLFEDGKPVYEIEFQRTAVNRYTGRRSTETFYVRVAGQYDIETFESGFYKLIQPEVNVYYNKNQGQIRESWTAAGVKKAS